MNGKGMIHHIDVNLSPSKWNDVVGEFRGDHTRNPKIVGAFLVNAL